MAICKFFQQGHCRKGFDCDFEHIRDGKKTPPFLGNSRDNIQQNSPPRRKSKRNSNKLEVPSGNGNFRNSNENLQVTKSHGQSHEVKKNKRNKNNSKKNKKNSQKNSYTKLPAYRPPESLTNPQRQRLPGIKDYVNMVISDLSERPALWHFSSYGLSLNAVQSLPFPHLGTVELSPEELRLQVYAEAAATGGRIDNYVKVVGEIKSKAEMVTKALIPQLETVISETLKKNNIPIADDQANGAVRNAYNAPVTQLTQTYHSTATPITQAYNPNTTNNNNANNTNIIAPVVVHEPLFQHPTIQYAPQSHQSNDIIPDDSFAFGMIPEIPPE